MDGLASKVAQRFNDTLIAARVAQKYALEEAAKKLPKPKLPDHHKLDELMTKLPFAIKVFRQKPQDKTSEREVERLMDEYTKYATAMHHALDAAIPKDSGKERERAQELFHKVDFFTNMPTYNAVLHKMPAETFAEQFKKAMPIWKELQQFLGGQRVLLAVKPKPEPAPLPEALLKLVSADAPKAKARAAEITKVYESLKKFQADAEDAKPAAVKKFDESYKKLYSLGEASAKAGDQLIEKLRQYENHIVDDSQAAHALHLLHAALGDWKRNRVDHLKVKEQFGYRMRALQAEQTWAYGKKIDDQVEMLDQAVKGEFD
jgi:hypothetical protein